MAFWQDKVVVVAGGSQGLGLEIAKSFHRSGSKVVILARSDEQRWAVVKAMNRNRAESADEFGVDMTEDDAARVAVDRIIASHSRIDVWVNAVGQSIRTDFMKTGLADYRRLMDQNFFASVNGSLAALPALAKSRGHLINIGSLASRTAWPFMAPYVTSKHALSGFAHQLRLEGPPEVHCLFVCPGPIASQDSPHRDRPNASGLPDAASRPGAGAPVKAIDARWLADRVVRACEKRQPDLVVPTKARLLFAIAQLFPSMADRLIRRSIR